MFSTSLGLNILRLAAYTFTYVNINQLNFVRTPTLYFTHDIFYGYLTALKISKSIKVRNEHLIRLYYSELLLKVSFPTDLIHHHICMKVQRRNKQIFIIVTGMMIALKW